MQIEVTAGLFWDTESTVQTEEAMEWLSNEVRPNLSEATRDKYGRPDERSWNNNIIKVVEKQEYIRDNGDLARRKVNYTVTQL